MHLLKNYFYGHVTKFLLTLVGMSSLFACSTGSLLSGGPSEVKLIAAKVAQDISCKNQNLETRLWDGLKSYLLEKKTFISAQELKKNLQSQLLVLQSKNPHWNPLEMQKVSQVLNHLVDTLLVEAPAAAEVKTPFELMGLLSTLDVGDRSSLYLAEMQDKIRPDFETLEHLIQASDLKCLPDPALEDQRLADYRENPFFEKQKQEALAAGVSLAVFGEHWAFATAYQSCQNLDVPALNSGNPDIQGIAIVGKHPDGIGNKRVISDLPLLQSTHPYIKDITNYAPNCFEVRNHPLIYDYGGKPSASIEVTSPLDLFKNNGDGTSVLGVDCSGYVFTAMATAGLRLKSGRPLKASDSWAWGSASYLEPQQNGLTCLEKIKVTANESLKAGDIVAVHGHVILIERAGQDPFGIEGVRSEKDCELVSSKKFDFVVAQSSPSLGGVGINHFVAKDYLPTSEKMNVGLQKYAYYACLAKVNQRTYLPHLGTLSVVRHKGTVECLAPRVNLVHEECIQTCNKLTLAH